MQAERTSNGQKVTLRGEGKEFEALSDVLDAFEAARARAAVLAGRIPSPTRTEQVLIGELRARAAQQTEQVELDVPSGMARRLYVGALGAALLARQLMLTVGSTADAQAHYSQFAGLTRDLAPGVVGSGASDISPAEHEAALQMLGINPQGEGLPPVGDS